MPSVKAELIVEVKNQAISGTDAAAAALAKLTDAANKAAGALTNVGKSTKPVKPAVDGLKQGLGQLSQQFLGVNLSTLGLVGGIGLLGMGLKKAVDAAAESERVFALTESAVKATGGAAGYTATQLDEMASKMSRLNAIDDETILSAESVLLTFKAIGHDVFPQAQQAAIDLSTAFKMDLQSATMMLGKALQDPIRGITALRRAGVSFTAEQQSTIKALVDTGRAAEAQAMILAELNSQVGGAGVAAAKTYSGQLALMKVNTENLAEAIGKRLLPPMTAVISTINKQLYAYGLIEEAKQKGIITEQKANQMMLFGRTEQVTVLLEAAMAADVVRKSYEEMGHASDFATGASDNLAKATSHAARSNVNSADAADRYTKALYDQAAGIDAVNAGLSGTLTQAQDDYNKVVAETQPEIDKLIKEIARMNAAQGKTWTVTTAATASVEEYQLAQLRAAVAQQKVNEATNDGSEDYLELVVASQRAAENVTKLGGELGMTETFTANYTKKLIEANAGLGELEGKLLTAEERLRRTTNEFIFQQLAVEGDWKANLELARTLGIMDEASYSAAVVLGKLKDEYLKTGDLDKYTEKTKAIADAIASLQDKHITITETHIYEELHTNQWSSDENRGQYGGGFASGADFVVPPGFPNDSYPMRVQSGEHVQVTPAGQAPGNGPTIGTVNVYGTTDPAETARLVGREIAGQLRRAMSGGVGSIAR